MGKKPQKQTSSAIKLQHFPAALKLLRPEIIYIVQISMYCYLNYILNILNNFLRAAVSTSDYFILLRGQHSFFSVHKLTTIGKIL